MPIDLTFMGAARSVTGSRYLLETGNLKLPSCSSAIRRKAPWADR
jgi:hypothetical protein